MGRSGQSVDLTRDEPRVLINIVAILGPEPTLPVLDRLHRILNVFVAQDPVAAEQQRRHQEIDEWPL